MQRDCPSTGTTGKTHHLPLMLRVDAGTLEPRRPHVSASGVMDRQILPFHVVARPACTKCPPVIPSRPLHVAYVFTAVQSSGAALT